MVPAYRNLGPQGRCHPLTLRWLDTRAVPLDSLVRGAGDRDVSCANPRTPLGGGGFLTETSVGCLLGI